MNSSGHSPAVEHPPQSWHCPSLRYQSPTSSVIVHGFQVRYEMIESTIIKGNLEVLTSDYTEFAGSSCSIDVFTAEMFRRVGIARNAVFFHRFVASKARKGRSEKRELRRIGCPRCRQNLHHACARERFGSQNR